MERCHGRLGSLEDHIQELRAPRYSSLARENLWSTMGNGRYCHVENRRNLLRVSLSWSLFFESGGLMILCRKTVAWTGLRFPWKLRPSISEEQKKAIQAQGMPPTLDGMNLDVFPILAQAMGATADYGYDPENDYRKRLFLYSLLSSLPSICG